jgi:UDP-glucose 4-epimerase
MPEDTGKKILVTGGAGYIGSHAIVSLIMSGYEVVSADNFSNSFEEVFRRIKLMTGKEVRNYNMDLQSSDFIDIIFKDNPDIMAVMHFAAFKSVPESVKKPELYYSNNIFSLINMLSSMRKFRCKNLVFSSSCSVYGNSRALPVNELTTLGKHESPYGFTKLKCEEIISDLVSNFKGMNAVSLRYFNPVGAHPSGMIGENPRKPAANLVPSIIKSTMIGGAKFTIHGNDYDTRDGTCIRDYVHVCDIADAHVMALKYMEDSKSVSHEIFNLGTGEGVTVAEAITAFEKSTGKKVSYDIGPKRDGDIPAVYSDSSKAEKILGWKPKLDIGEMMRSSWEWEKNKKKKSSFV